MKNALVILDSAIMYNQPFVAYIKREIASHTGEIETIRFIAKRDDDVVEVLKEVIAEHRYVFVVTAENFSFAGKIIATICHDGLVLKEKDMLVPFKAERYTKNSYLIMKDTTSINVLKVDLLQKLPPLLISTPKKEISFYLFDEALQETLEAQITQLELGFEKVVVIEGLFFYKVKGVQTDMLEHFLEILDMKYRQNVLRGEDLSHILCRRLIEGDLKITTAESCTGGMLASEIVKNNGVSSIFDGGVVTYSNEMKHKLLGVREATLHRYGAVSQECVQEMLKGVMEKFDADFSLAVSGVAGPSGGTRQKPVGTVYVGAKCKGKETIIKRLSLKGDRTYIREQSVFWAFRLLAETNREFFFKKIAKTLDK